MLISYIRDQNNNPIGAVVAIGPGVNEIGWSMWHPKKETNRFTKERAIDIALGRAQKGHNGPPPNRKAYVNGQRIKGIDAVSLACNLAYSRAQRYFA